MDVDAKTVVPAPTRMGSTPSANAVFGAIGGVLEPLLLVQLCLS